MQLQTKVLRRPASPEEYRLYRAGLEWDLVDPIVIESRKDLKSEPTWRGKLEPYHHQVSNLITFCRRLPVTLLADDVGLGKTISAGLVASELISRARVTRILIVCPKLLGPQWREELETKFGFAAVVVTGRALIDAEPIGTAAVITTYHSARMYLDRIPADRFQMLVLDEAHKLRNLYGTNTPPQVAKCFYGALAERRFPFVLMLTATPIQNRLWDLYSLVDLLTVARGHKNPFGTEGVFVRKFIADGRTQARKLKAEAQEEFRSIVYSYMSRVRRGDAKLYFPDRVVQLHRVKPTAGEIALIGLVAKGIERLNRLAQISVLQALASSPDALSSQLSNMARRGTVPAQLAQTVQALVSEMPPSAKLAGLGKLIEQLRTERPDRWRVVIFTGRLETQTTIQLYLERLGLTVGIINGMSGARNQETLARFRKTPPAYHVIVSTEAGSEGINLQVANVVVNFDLPWNPMIVEQRIGRVQRLASEYAKVAIFNVILEGTFEEYIVGRLMEKLQMAAHAIGDIESLLQAAGMDEEEEADVTSFEEKLRKLVVAALTGKDVAAGVRQAEQSIAEARSQLQEEEENINKMLGGMDGAEYVGPRLPKLPAQQRSMPVREFTIGALRSLGATIADESPNPIRVDWDGTSELITFDPLEKSRATHYDAGTPAFAKLVQKIVASGGHWVTDSDVEPESRAKELCSDWVRGFESAIKDISVGEVFRCFNGIALVRARATVAHDSYERLVEVSCQSGTHRRRAGKPGLWKLGDVLDTAAIVNLGIDADAVAATAEADPALSEFRRFYLERRAQEMEAAGGDERKRRKLEEEFTPRLQLSLAGLEGCMHRDILCHVRFTFDAEKEYETALICRPATGELLDAPPMGRCVVTGKAAPITCLKQCDISRGSALSHLLVSSEISGRSALPQFCVRCSVSGKTVLQDEAAVSDVSGELVAKPLLLQSPISRKFAEHEHFVTCDFSNSRVLATETEISAISGKRYRQDQGESSSISARRGHNSEFVTCAVSGARIASDEAEQCQVTSAPARRGLLVSCDVTGQRVLPTQIDTCAVSGKKVLKKLLVSSNVSGVRFLEALAVKSSAGNMCAPDEAKECAWSGQRSHPEDLKTCELTTLSIHSRYCTEGPSPKLKELVELLDGRRRSEEMRTLWDSISPQIANALGKGKCRVESAALSPNRKAVAVCSEVRTLLGLRTEQAGVLYSLDGREVIGRPARGRRTPKGWMQLA